MEKKYTTKNSRGLFKLSTLFFITLLPFSVMLAISLYYEGHTTNATIDALIENIILIILSIFLVLALTAVFFLAWGSIKETDELIGKK